MPYICLARNDVPDGTVQVLDLMPNSSQRTIYDPPGQTRYVNRVQGVLPLAGATGQTLTTGQGLVAYLADRVAVGTTATATGTFTFATVVNPGHTVSIKGVPFFNVAVGLPPTPALQEFDGSSGDDAAAASLALAINDPATQALLLAALPVGVTVTAANIPATPLVTLTASLPGVVGEAVTLASTGATILVGAMTIAGGTAWTASTLTARAAALIARMDAGLAMTLGDVNTVLGAVGATFTAGGSTGVITELLSLLAGRGYTLPIGAVKFTGGVWDPTILGSFTHAGPKFDTVWSHGEFRPTFPNLHTGDVVQTENKPIRHTYDSTAFQVSLGAGHLAAMANGMTLFPDSVTHDLSAPLQPYDQVNNARLVTVYDDDGSLLA